jgi:thymidylate synthase
MNNLDKQYQALLQDVLDNGVVKQDRTTTGTISVFGRQIRHKMSEGFPLLTTKKVFWKGVVVELLWFLRGDTNIQWLVENGISIWNGDAFKRYWDAHPDAEKTFQYEGSTIETRRMTKEEFINKIKTDDEFAKEWGDLGPTYGKSWRDWLNLKWEATDKVDPSKSNQPMIKWNIESIDQIANLIRDLKTNPDSRRLMVNAWNVGELDSMVLPPCHYGFQVYTRELSLEERYELVRVNGLCPKYSFEIEDGKPIPNKLSESEWYDKFNVPTRAISLMWNQRSVDTFLGLPFNIASYGLLLEIIAKAVNMVPDELIGNLGDVHLYSNHIEQAKEQIGRALSIEERIDLASKKYDNFDIMDFGIPFTCTHEDIDKFYPVERRTREPFPLPTLVINDEFWNPDADLLSNLPHVEVSDFYVENYQSHPTIKAPLSC